MLSYRSSKVIRLLQQLTNHPSSTDVVQLCWEARELATSDLLCHHLLELAECPMRYDDDEGFLDTIIQELQYELNY